jgi:Zn-dependent protease with chaperone function
MEIDVKPKIDALHDRLNFVVAAGVIGSTAVATTLLLNEPAITAGFVFEALKVVRDAMIFEKAERAELTARQAKLPRQYKRVLSTIDHYSKTLGIKRPHFFAVSDSTYYPGASATEGVREGHITFRNLESYTRAQREFILGHEMGHLLGKHGAKKSILVAMKAVALANTALCCTINALNVLSPEATRTALSAIPQVCSNPFATPMGPAMVAVAAPAIFFGLKHVQARYSQQNECYADKVGAHLAGVRTGIESLTRLGNDGGDLFTNYRMSDLPMKRRLSMWRMYAFDCTHPPLYRRLDALAKHLPSKPSAALEAALMTFGRQREGIEAHRPYAERSQFNPKPKS